MKGNEMSGIELLLNDSRGVYIPRDFAMYFENMDGIESEDIDILKAGPDESDWYWETWDSVLSNASYKDEKGNVWRLYQDGDLFAYCEELMDDEEYYNFFGEPRSDLDTDSRSETDNWYDTSAELA
jgi:hypothetical protein